MWMHKRISIPRRQIFNVLSVYEALVCSWYDVLKILLNSSDIKIDSRIIIDVLPQYTDKNLSGTLS